MNPYVKDFLLIAELDESNFKHFTFVINPDAKPKHEHSRIHGHNLREVAVLTSEVPSNLDIVLHRRSGSLTIVSDIHRSFDPLHFVLLFPLGTEGWHCKIQQK